MPRETVEIENVAQCVHDLSLKYELASEIFACNELIYDEIKKAEHEDIGKLTKKLRDETRKGNKAEAMKLTIQLNSLREITKSKRFRIFISYLDGFTGVHARVIRIGNQYEIALPKSLADKARDNNTITDYASLRELRELISHEIGHIVLHSTQISAYDIQGSLRSAKDEDGEADCFRDKLLELKRQRSIKFCEENGYNKI